MLVVNTFANADHIAIAWRPDGDPANWTPIENCWGFAIQRRLRNASGEDVRWLSNRIGFAKDEPFPTEPWRWPIQRYIWWDYDVEPGDRVAYRVAPVLAPNDALVKPDASDLAWSAETLIGPETGGAVSAWFNRGVIATPWVTRALKARNAAGLPRTSLLEAASSIGDPLREELAGYLKPALLNLLGTAPGPVYAAMYELNDVEVIDAFVALGPRCHLILGNGAFKPPERDENESVREQLRGTSINLHDRIVGSGHFAHNKFIVFCDTAGNPASVWTGSTNLTGTGLCTQVNNGILIDNAAVAGDFLAAWRRLEQAGNGYPAALVDGNSAATARSGGQGENITAWFAATKRAQDLEHARRLIRDAKDGILFLFFNPGAYVNEPFRETLLQTIITRKEDPDLYVRGVVNQEIDGLTDASSTAPVNLVRSGTAEADHLPKSVLVPAAIKEDFEDWEKELKGASSVMVHSKVVVLDPFGDHPVVMTGSHNLGYKASSKNDDNLVIIEGNAPLAQAFATNIVAIFQEYRWRDYVATHSGWRWHGLEPNAEWQDGHLEREVLDMLFWVPQALG